MRDQLKAMVVGVTSKFVPLPPGAPSHGVRNVNQVFYKKEGWPCPPGIAYRQPPNDKICLVVATCNLLQFLGKTILAKTFFSKTEEILTAGNPWNTFCDLLQKVTKGLEARRQKKSELDLKTDEGPLISAVKGSDGKDNHVVAIYQGWVFDGNYPNALVQRTESLDMCCDSTFVGVGQRAYRIVQKSSYKGPKFF